MSYEGYEQHICRTGHRFDTPADLMALDDIKCPICQEVSDFVNDVDDTNCDSYGIIPDFSAFLISEEKREVCNLGHDHIVHEAIYRLPTQEEKKVFRHYRRDGMLVPCSKR